MPWHPPVGPRTWPHWQPCWHRLQREPPAHLAQRADTRGAADAPRSREAHSRGSRLAVAAQAGLTRHLGAFWAARGAVVEVVRGGAQCVRVM